MTSHELSEGILQRVLMAVTAMMMRIMKTVTGDSVEGVGKCSVLSVRRELNRLPAAPTRWRTLSR